MAVVDGVISAIWRGVETLMAKRHGPMTKAGRAHRREVGPRPGSPDAVRRRSIRRRRRGPVRSCSSTLSWPGRGGDRRFPPGQGCAPAGSSHISTARTRRPTSTRLPSTSVLVARRPVGCRPYRGRDKGRYVRFRWSSSLKFWADVRLVLRRTCGRPGTRAHTRADHRCA